MKERGRQFIRNALAVSLSAVLMRCVGVSFNVYLTGKLGADGIGLYTLVMSVYSFAVTVATSGIHLAATRLVAEAGEDARAVRAAMRAALGYSAAFGCGAAVLLFSLSPVISAHWLEDVRTLPSLRLLALGLPPLALSSALGGYFAGVRRVHKSAAVQLCEQGTRVVVIICALQVFLPGGLEYACIGVVLGGMLAELISFCLLFGAFLWDRHRHFPARVDPLPAAPMRRKLCGIALPVAVSAYARSLLITVEHLLIPICLRKNGATRDASLAAYGTLQSMVLPILLFPLALLGSVSGLLIPEMAEYRARGEQAQIDHVASRVMRLALIFSIGAAGNYLYDDFRVCDVLGGISVCIGECYIHVDADIPADHIRSDIRRYVSVGTVDGRCYCGMCSNSCNLYAGFQFPGWRTDCRRCKNVIFN